MRYFRQALIIFGIYFIGEGIKQVTQLPIPGNLIGMLLLFLLLCFRVIKVEQISELSDFLLGHMPFFFIPAGVALMTSFALVEQTWLQIVLICLFTTFLIMAVSGVTIQKLMERKGKPYE